jgi:hypothetical protein
MCQPACGFQLIERELSTLVARIEALGAEVNGVGAVGDGGSYSIEGARGRKQLRDLGGTEHTRNLADFR